MKLELRKADGKTVGYSLVPENKTEQNALKEIRTQYFFGTRDDEMCYESTEIFSEGGVELPTRMKFLKRKYREDLTEERKAKSYPVVENNTPVDMLRLECFAVIREEMRKNYDGNSLEILMSLSLQHKELPVAVLVLETYLGIIGYQKWLNAHNKESASFIGDALHDLSGCLQYDRKDGYSPRTHRYIEFYKS